MGDTQFRYPGAQPFRDDDLARQTFFGREAAVVALTNQVLANRLVVVYAKSGIGKTSLLNAGVAPKLRDAGTIPLLVRVNDLDHELLPSVLERIRSEAARQKIEYVPGDASSLWNFFKTVQFWRGDLLLTPVLVVDQFEELFTLQADEAREKFLSELSYVVRGVAPAESSGTSQSDTPPAIHVVLSLREDFLGLLEEASDRIPQILDHRFRLAPLDRETAADAITCPAQIDDPNFATKPFDLAPEVVSSVLDYLTRSASGVRTNSSRYVEPFHLQLICQRIERLVAAKEKLTSRPVRFTLQDLGGERALADTLSGFYEDAIRSLKGMRLRGAARRLCEQYLISPEGRRLSLEERELQMQLKMPHDALQQLVDRRLLRTDRRAENTYYELSHDALVQPVLASRRIQALLISWVTVVAGVLVSLAAVFLLFAAFYALATKYGIGKLEGSDFGIAIFFFIVAGAVGSLSVRWVRSGNRARKRYRRRRAGELAEELPTILPLRKKLLGWMSLLTGGSIDFVYCLGGLLLLLSYTTRFVNHGRLPRWLLWLGEDTDWQLVHDHPFREIGWGLIELAVIVALGWLLIQFGSKMLWPHRAPITLKRPVGPDTGRPLSPWAVLLKLAAGSCALIIAVTYAVALWQCVPTSQGRLPSWLGQNLFGSDLPETCATLHQHRYSFAAFSMELFMLAAYVFAVILLLRGAREVRNLIRYRRLQRLSQNQNEAAATQGAR